MKFDDPSAFKNCLELQIFMRSARVIPKLNPSLGGEPANLAHILALRTPLFDLKNELAR